MPDIDARRVDCDTVSGDWNDHAIRCDGAGTPEFGDADLETFQTARLASAYPTMQKEGDSRLVRYLCRIPTRA